MCMYVCVYAQLLPNNNFKSALIMIELSKPILLVCTMNFR